MKQKTGRKILSFLLTLALVIGVLPRMELTVKADGYDVSNYAASVTSGSTTTNYDDFSAAVSAWTDGSTLKLLADVTTDSTIRVSGTKTLDLNGYGIKMTGSGRVISVTGGANFTLKDSNTDNMTHKFTVDDPSEKGAGLATVNDDLESGYQTFTGGYITGGSAGQGGGVYVDGGVFNMSGGNIIGNRTTNQGYYEGGGVALSNDSNSHFVMTGGTVQYNTSIGRGGGLGIPNNATAELSGDAKIMYNMSSNNDWGGGISSFGILNISGDVKVMYNRGGSAVHPQQGSFNVSGAPVIYDNEVTYCNILPEVKINVVGTITEDAKFGVRIANGGVFTTGGKAKDYASNFISDDPAYTVQIEGDELKLAKPPVASVTSGDTTTNYADINEAINALEDGSTLKLLADVTLADGMDIPKNNVIVDLGGNVITLNSFKNIAYANWNIAPNSTLTIQNGTINSLLDSNEPNTDGVTVYLKDVMLEGGLCMGRATYYADNTTFIGMVGLEDGELYFDTMGDREGYTFEGWYTDSGFQNKWTESMNPATTDNRSVVLFPKWTASVTVTFNTKGGSNVESQTVASGRRVTEPDNPTKEGYAFVGWYSDEAFTTAWDFESDTVTEDTTLYAKWKQAVSYTVTFKVENGSWNEGEGDVATADKNVTVTGYEGDTLKMTADQIPAVGTKPDDTYKAGSWDVTPNTDTAITQDITYTYTYEQKTSITPSVSINGWTYGEIANTPEVEGNAGDGEVTYTYAKKGTTDFSEIVPSTAGEYTVKAVLAETDDYLGGEATADFTIAKAEVAVPTITDKHYTGENQTADIVGSDLYTVTANNGGTDAGSYDVVLTLNDADNYKWTDSEEAAKTLSFKIVSAEINTVTVSIDGWKYGDSAKTPTATAAFGADTAVYTYSDAEDGEYSAFVPGKAGVWYVKASVPATDNYPAGEAIASFVIAKAEPSVTVPTEKSVIYNGSAQELANGGSTEDGTLYYALTTENTVSADELLYSTAIPTATDAGTYTVWYKVIGDENHVDSAPQSIQVMIEPAAITIMADDKSTIYKKKIAALTYNVGGGYVEGDDLGVKLSTTATEESEPGDYPIVVSWNKNPNYNASIEDGQYFVTRGGVSITVSGYSGVYDGKPHGITVEEIQSELGEFVGIFGDNSTEAAVYYGTVELNKDNYKDDGTKESVTFTDAGEYTVYYYVESKGYTVDPVSGSKKVQISKAPLEVTAKDAVITYGDKPKDNGVEYSGFVNGDTFQDINGTITYSIDYEQYGDAGKSYSIISNGVTGKNYDITFVPGKLTVNPKSLTFTWDETSKELIYNGEKQSITAEAETLNGDVLTLKYSDNEKINAGTYTAKIIGIEGEKAVNYQLPDDVSVTTYEWKIEKKKMSVTAKNVTVEYDGKKHGIEVSVSDPDSAYSISYGKENGEYNSRKSPVITKEGSLTVYYKVEAANYITYTGSAKVTVKENKEDKENKEGTSSSSVDVKEGTPAISVKGLEEEAKTLQEGQSGDVNVTMSVEQLSEENDDSDGIRAIKKIAEGRMLTFFDIKVIKAVDSVKTRMSTTTNILEICIPYNHISEEGLAVYRYHESVAKRLTESDSGQDGTYRVDKRTKKVYIYTNQFSIYAIGYTVKSSVNEEGDTIYDISGNIKYEGVSGVANLILYRNGEECKRGIASFMDGMGTYQFEKLKKGNYSLKITMDAGRDSFTLELPIGDIAKMVVN